MAKNKPFKGVNTAFPLGNYMFIVLAIFLTLGAGKTIVQAGSLSYDSPYEKVLGDSDEAEKPEENKPEENKPTENRPEENKPDEVAKKTDEQAREVAKSQAEKLREAAKEIEIQAKDGSKIKIKREDNNQIKMELEKGNLHFKYESTPAGVVKNVETSDGASVQLSQNQLNKLENHVENELEKNGLEVDIKDGETRVSSGGFVASTIYPLSVAGTDKTLAISTPEGEKEIKLTPDEIIKRLSESDEIASPSGNLADQSMEIKMKDGQPVYEVNSKKVYNLLGMFKVAQPLKLVVSADTGEVIATDQSLFANLISMLSLH